ncbi:MAG: fumarate hydratase [Candidatus Thiodiazotropha sp.]
MSVEESNKLRVNLNPISLEADLAYFGARLELVGEPETSYQAAQLKVYKALEAALEENLKRLRKSESRAKAKKKKNKKD